MRQQGPVDLWLLGRLTVPELNHQQFPGYHDFGGEKGRHGVTHRLFEPGPHTQRMMDEADARRAGHPLPPVLGPPSPPGTTHDGFMLRSVEHQAMTDWYEREMNAYKDGHRPDEPVLPIRRNFETG